MLNLLVCKIPGSLSKVEGKRLSFKSHFLNEF